MRGAEHAARRADGRTGARTASARRGAGQPLPGGAARAAAAAAGGLGTPPPAAPAKPGGGRGGGKPSLLSPSPGPSLAPPSPPPSPPYLTPPAVTNLLPCPRLAGKQKREGTQGPGSISWGAGRGGRRAPLPGREAVLKLGIRSVILEPGSNPDCPPPSCRKQNPFARMPSSPVSPPLQIEMVQAPGAPAPPGTRIRRPTGRSSEWS